MKSVLSTLMLLTFAMPLFVSGCSTSAQRTIAVTEGDKRMVKMIECMNHIADAVEAGKSDGYIKGLQEKYESARKKMASLPAKEQTLPATKYAIQLQTAQKRMAESVIAHTMTKVKSMHQFGN